MLYLYVFPYPALQVYKFSLKRQKALNDARNELEEEQLLTLKQSNAIRLQISKLERLNEEEMERKDRAISLRDNQIAQLQKEISDLSGQLKHSPKEESEEITNSDSQNDIASDGQPTTETKTQSISIKSQVIGILKHAIPEGKNPITRDQIMYTILRILYGKTRISYDELISHFEDGTKAEFCVSEMLNHELLSRVTGAHSMLELSHEVKRALIEHYEELF